MNSETTEDKTALDCGCCGSPVSVSKEAHGESAPNPCDPAFVSEIRRSAEESFANGLYCAESVVLAIARAQGIESDLLPKVATAFCGGMAQTCGACGALTGAVMGISLTLGRSSIDETEQASYAATRKLVHEFEREFGARNCDELLGCDLSTQEGQDKFRNEGLSTQCAAYTSKAAEIAARLIGEHANAKT